MRSIANRKKPLKNKEQHEIYFRVTVTVEWATWTVK
ncbi:unnamed protein product [Brugia timori]|uniref:Uncharacterized protein n=1 Tax=Brugia timori TaxID=42155 RepID=A0A0R3QCB0_9BILA|nr:unnamed protein product [Brugia timori]